MKQTEHPYWHRLYKCLEDFGTRYQNIPDFFKDRIQRYGILSLFILLFGLFMGTWMKRQNFYFLVFPAWDYRVYKNISYFPHRG